LGFVKSFILKEKVSARDSLCPVKCAAFFILPWVCDTDKTSLAIVQIYRMNKLMKKKEGRKERKKEKRLCIVKNTGQ
jgi:hypothetical protein